MSANFEKAAKSKKSYTSVSAGRQNVMEGLGEPDGDFETDETDDPDETAATELRNDGVRQIASADLEPPPQRAAGSIERGEPPERDGPVHPAKAPVANPVAGGSAGEGKQRTTTTTTTSTTQNTDDSGTTDGPPAASVIETLSIPEDNKIITVLSTDTSSESGETSDGEEVVPADGDKSWPVAGRGKRKHPGAPPTGGASAPGADRESQRTSPELPSRKLTAIAKK